METTKTFGDVVAFDFKVLTSGLTAGQSLSGTWVSLEPFDETERYKHTLCRKATREEAEEYFALYQ